MIISITTQFKLIQLNDEGDSSTSLVERLHFITCLVVCEVLV